MVEVYNPKAFLRKIRNVRQGLKTRTIILSALESSGKLKAEDLASTTGLSYNVVLWHLKLMEKEGIVKRTGKKPYDWKLTGLGQKTLAEFSKP